MNKQELWKAMSEPLEKSCLNCEHSIIPILVRICQKKVYKDCKSRITHKHFNKFTSSMSDYWEWNGKKT